MRQSIITALAVLAGIILTASPANAGKEHHQDRRQREVVVHVVDNTRGAWPVKPAMHAWSKMRGVRFKLAPDCADTRRFCVIVDAWDHGDSGWMGLTTHLTKRLAHVQLNTSEVYAYAAGTRAQQRSIVCHELAHTLGVAHPAPSQGVSGCIANSDHAHSTPKPTGADRALVREVLARPQAHWGAFRYAWLQAKVA